MVPGRLVPRLPATVLIGAVLWGLGSLQGEGQALPGVDGMDLTTPPEMRASKTPPSQPRSEKRPHARNQAAHARAETTTGERHAATAPSDPVELGVTVRGGSGVPHPFGATGTSEAIQESGSGFGAGMRFGF